jgi:transcriptional regulator with XRE-family HTH domain
MDDPDTIDTDLSKPGTRRVPRRNKGKERFSLRTVRDGMGKTQAEVATNMETNQGEVSRIEHRDDVMLSTLRKYARAIGASCELVFVLPDGRRVPIEDGDLNMNKANRLESTRGTRERAPLPAVCCGPCKGAPSPPCLPRKCPPPLPPWAGLRGAMRKAAPGRRRLLPPYRCPGVSILSLGPSRRELHHEAAWAREAASHRGPLPVSCWQRRLDR